MQMRQVYGHALGASHGCILRKLHTPCRPAAGPASHSTAPACRQTLRTQAAGGQDNSSNSSGQSESASNQPAEPPVSECDADPSPATPPQLSTSAGNGHSTADSGNLSNSIPSTATGNSTSMSSQPPSPPDAFSMGLARAMRKLAAFEAYSELLLGTRPGDPLDLFHCAFLIAQHAHPMASEDVCRAAVQDIVTHVRARLPSDAYPLRVVQEVIRVMYGELGFTGNSTDYSSPDNSCINKVLERRTGIPISLSLVFMEVSASLGVPFEAIPLPAHLMIRPSLPGVELLVDAFSGEMCMLEDAEKKLAGLLGAEQVVIDPKFVTDERGMSPRAFLLRWLNNLKASYLSSKDVENALSIIRYMKVTAVGMPEWPGNDMLRDEGLCLYSLKRWHECSSVLREYLQAAPQAPDALMVYVLLDRVNQQMKAASEAVKDGDEAEGTRIQGMPGQKQHGERLGAQAQDQAPKQQQQAKEQQLGQSSQDEDV